MAGGVAPEGITAWVAQHGQVLFFFAQIAFWLLLVGVLAWATWIFKRYVDFATGAVGEEEGGESSDDEAVSIEEFVE